MRWSLVMLLFFTRSVWGELSEIPWPDLETQLPLWKPNASEGQCWPAIIYYHGTNGRPTISPLRDVTKGMGFVLVGMTYVDKGRFQQSDENIALEQSQLDRLKRLLVEEHAVDRSQIYVAGFSKGGWFAATLLERDPTLAGGLVLGAGVFHGKGAPAVVPFETSKPIFIGVGRFDGNYPQSLTALLHFRKLGAEVTLEAWPNTMHALPKEVPEGMRQWLRLREGTSARAEMDHWIKSQRATILTMSDPVERWYAWREMLERPFVKEAGQAVAAQVETQIKLLAKDSIVAEEQRFVQASQEILRRETKDRYVSTLEDVLPRFEKLAEEAKGTLAGTTAREDAARVRALLGNAP